MNTESFETFENPKVEEKEPETGPSNPRLVETTPSIPKQPEGVRNLPKTIQARENGLLVGGSLEDQYRLAKAYCNSGLMPKGLQTPEKVLVALQLCAELGLPPMSSIGKIAVINGTPSLFGDLPLALVRRSGMMREFKEWWIMDEKGDVIGAACKAVRKDDPNEVLREFSIEDAKKAGLFRNDIWNKYTKRMLQFRARSWCLKDAFPDVLSGSSIAEYDFDSTVDEHGNMVGAPIKTVASELNERFLGEEKKDGQS